MHFYNIIKDLAKEEELDIFVDMDGVIAAYDVGKPYDFMNKRPLNENLNKLKKVSEISNVELNILSVCRKDAQIQEKNYWLDKYAPFFKKENRNILSKENINGILTSELKANFLKNIKSNKKIILIDDDNSVIKYIVKNIEGVTVFQDSELID